MSFLLGLVVLSWLGYLVYKAHRRTTLEGPGNNWENVLVAVTLWMYKEYDMEPISVLVWAPTVDTGETFLEEYAPSSISRSYLDSESMQNTGLSACFWRFWASALHTFGVQAIFSVKDIP